MNDDTFIDEVALAARLSIPAKSLRDRRNRGLKIPFVKIGRNVRYHWPTVRNFFLQQIVVQITPAKPETPYANNLPNIPGRKVGRPRKPVQN